MAQPTSLEYAVHTSPVQAFVPDKKTFLEMSNNACDPKAFERSMHQHVAQYYLSVRSSHRSLLLFQGLGTGKSCAAIAVAESLMAEMPPQSMTPPPLPKAAIPYSKAYVAPVWILTQGTLEQNFRKQIFDVIKLQDPMTLKEQCTGDTYIKLVQAQKNVKTKMSLEKKIQTIVNSRYHFFTESDLASMVRALSQDELKSLFKNKTLIIDEAHNIRVGDSKDKNIVGPITDLLKASDGSNRLLLLSATPMYDDPEEILWLLSLLLLNDKDKTDISNVKLFNVKKKEATEPNEEAFEILKGLSNRYISYVKGQNPFIFPVRLSPSANGVPMYSGDSKPTKTKAKPKLKNVGAKQPDAKADAWWEAITDGIVHTPIGMEQQKAIKMHLDMPLEGPDPDPSTLDTKPKKKLKKNQKDEQQQDHLNTLLQFSNVTFPKGQGFATAEEGITATFDSKFDNPLQLEYKSKEYILNPLKPELMNNYASKIKRVTDFITSCDGICTVYSQFIMGGVVPIAIALEHLGYKRYKSSYPLLKLANPPPAAMKGKRQKTYCIMSGKSNLMGVNINDMEQAINMGLIDVVLMTTKVSEGFSFKNVREVHILDPWYNLNRLEQIIGRAIRTCSHTSLELEKRNVTVYLHATVDKSIETPEIHSYRISAIKARNIALVERTIQENAMDCSLEYNLNWIPQSLFGFEVTMETGQKKHIKYKFGNTGEPLKCTSPAMAPNFKFNKDSWRPEVYDHLVPALQQRLRRFLMGRLHNHPEGATLQQVLKAMGTESSPGLQDVALRAIQKALETPDFVFGHNIVSSNARLFLVPVNKAVEPTYIKLGNNALTSHTQALHSQDLKDGESDEGNGDDDDDKETGSVQKQKQKQGFDVTKVLSGLLADLPSNDFDGIIRLYESINAESWRALAKHLLTGPPELAPRIIKLLKAEGALVHVGDIIGYVDIFADKYALQVLDEGEFREALPEEVDKVKKKLKLTDMPQTVKKVIGFMGIHKSKAAPSTLVFKLMYPDKGTAAKHKNRGAICLFMTKADIETLLKDDLKQPFDSSIKTRPPLCSLTIKALHKQGRLFLPPMYKPRD